jgi:uncharacterized protein (DUF1499 family)
MTLVAAASLGGRATRAGGLRRRTALALAVAGPPLFLPGGPGSAYSRHSTDTDSPPRYVAVLALRAAAENPVDYSAEAAAQQKKAYPDIVPVLLDTPPAQAYARAERAAHALGWDIVAAVPGELRIEATDTTLLFGFKDDIVIRIAPAGKGSRVDVRSLSRVGKSDLGVNANRIRKYLGQLAAG